MKMTFITLAVLIISGFTSTNAQQVTNSENERIVTHVVGNHYSVMVYNTNGALIQEGQYYKVKDALKPHGLWKLYDYNTQELVTKAMYEKGNQLWVETYIDGEMIRITQKEIEANKLEPHVAHMQETIQGNSF